MSKLPARLQPMWPLFKRLHRLLTLLLGVVFRRTSFGFGERGVPTSAARSSVDLARTNPAVRLHPGGPSEHLTRKPAVGEPPHHWVHEQARTATVPGRYALEIEGGMLAGDTAAVIAPGKTLDYGTSGYFGIRSWREHPLYLRPHLGELERVPGTVLSLACRGSAINYYHFVYDSLARLGVAEEALPGLPVDAVIVPHGTRYQRQFLELLGLDVPLLQPRAGHTFVADRLIVPSTPNDALEAPRFTVDWLRSRLTPTPGAETPRRLFVTRGSTPGTRIYLEEAALRPWLDEHGFTVVDPGTLSVQEQIDHFAGAEIVVGPHGAGLTNITFCSPGTTVVELFAASYVHLGLRNIADAIEGVDYRYLVAEGDHPVGKPMLGIYDDISIPPERLAAVLEVLLGDRQGGR